jgi:hypothetical protein
MGLGIKYPSPERKPSILLGSYTYSGMQYCDERFIQFLDSLQYPKLDKLVLENSPGTSYFGRLQGLSRGTDVAVERVNPELISGESRFHAVVAGSANILRDTFLAGSYDVMVILEADVFPQTDFLNKYLDVYGLADLIGGVYYHGYHHHTWFAPDHSELVPAPHPTYPRTILSGCTFHSRPLLQRVPFRYNPDALAAFPDAWMCHDAVENGFRCADYTAIKCTHVKP